MFTLLKSSLTFVICYLLLTVPLNDRPLFYHLHEKTSPYTNKIIFFMIEKAKTSVYSAKKLFINSNPALNEDTVNSKYSSVAKKIKKKEDLEKDLPLDSYTVEEEELIKKLIK